MYIYYYRSDNESNNIYNYSEDANKQQNEPKKVEINENGDDQAETINLHQINKLIIPGIHANPVKFLRFNQKFQTMISIDKEGFIEFWDPFTQDFPKGKLNFTCKIDSDLFDLVKKKVTPRAFQLSNTGLLFAL